MKNSALTRPSSACPPSSLRSVRPARRVARAALVALSSALLLGTLGCESPVRTHSACGDPGTNTVQQPDGCHCVAGYRADTVSNTCVPIEPEMPVTPPDGGMSDPDGGGGEDTGAPATPPPPGTLREVDAPEGHCASGCAAIGFGCATSCEGTAGFASYGYYDWDYGFYRGVHQADLLSCDAVPMESHDEGGETYDLGRTVCCCEIPEITTVSANDDDDRTCTQICTDAGHSGCAEFQEWPNEDTNGGTLAQYRRRDTGSLTGIVMGCEANPPAVRRIVNIDRHLDSYRCACH